MMMTNDLEELRLCWSRIDALKSHNKKLRIIVFVQMAVLSAIVILICLSLWDSLFAQ